jgi:hypothetical protein
MKVVNLTKGRLAYVDDKDYEAVSEFSWQAQKIKTGWVVKRGVWDPDRGNNRSQSLGVFLLRPPPGLRVDHRDGDPFNNQRANLRLCTKTENDRAFRRKAVGKSSRFRGVSWWAQRAKWRSVLETNGRQFHLGTFDREEDAARAYDAAAKQHFGEFAHLNLTGHVVLS